MTFCFQTWTEWHLAHITLSVIFDIYPHPRGRAGLEDPPSLPPMGPAFKKNPWSKGFLKQIIIWKSRCWTKINRASPLPFPSMFSSSVLLIMYRANLSRESHTWARHGHRLLLVGTAPRWRSPHGGWKWGGGDAKPPSLTVMAPFHVAASAACWGLRHKRRPKNLATQLPKLQLSQDLSQASDFVQ